MKNADLGFDNSNLLSVNLGNIDAGYEEKYTKSKLYKENWSLPVHNLGCRQVRSQKIYPGIIIRTHLPLILWMLLLDECLVTSTAVDENFSKVFKVNVVHGRFFSEDFGNDRQAFIINETALKKFGWKDIEGKYLKLSHEGDVLPVIGVMKDIHITTLKQPISPMIYRYGQHNNFPAFLTFRIEPGHTGNALAFMKKEWTTLFPGAPFDYLEVKETYFKNYEEEQRLSKIVGIFASARHHFVAFWPDGIDHVLCGKPDQGNRNSQGKRCPHRTSNGHAQYGIHQMDCHCLCHRLPHCLVRHAQMAAKLCL